MTYDSTRHRPHTSYTSCVIRGTWLWVVRGVVVLRRHGCMLCVVVTWSYRGSRRGALSSSLLLTTALLPSSST